MKNHFLFLRLRIGATGNYFFFLSFLFFLFITSFEFSYSLFIDSPYSSSSDKFITSSFFLFLITDSIDYFSSSELSLEDYYEAYYCY